MCIFGAVVCRDTGKSTAGTGNLLALHGNMGQLGQGPTCKEVSSKEHPCSQALIVYRISIGKPFQMNGPKKQRIPVSELLV